MKNLLLLIFFFISIYAATSYAQIIHVPGDQQTIQAGINAAQDGDTVLVDEGTYYENINFNGKAITVASQFFIDGDESHIENTIINGSQPSHPDSGSVVYFVSGEDTTSVLCGFTITGGTGTMIFILPSVQVPVGGGIIIYGISGGKILSNKIINNTVSNGSAGGGLFAGPEDNDAFVILENNLFDSNSCLNGYVSQGGGASIGTNASIINNTFQNNIVTCTVDGEAWGGGFTSWGSDSVLVFGNTILNNKVQAYTGIGALGGGFIFFMNSPSFIRMTGNVVAYNEIISSCGSAGAGGSIENTAGDVLFANNLVYNNYYSGLSNCHGTGLCIHDSTSVSIINNTITGNEASPLGGALCIWDPSYSSTTLAMNNISWGNSVGTAQPEIFVSAGNSPVVVYSDVQGGWPGEGNIDYDPLFSDTLFHLSDSSPCIGAGKDSILIGATWYYCPFYDYFKNPRPNPSGTMPDIGACESPLGNPVGVKDVFSEIPIEYSLEQNFPNPFNSSTAIQYFILQKSNVRLKVYDILGNEVTTLVNEEKDQGVYTINFDANNLASGLYLYRIQAGSFIDTKKMILLK